jgi:hypothetical protein
VREWRQFVLLSRDGVRRLLNTAFFGRDADPMPFVIWGVAFAATPPTLHAFRRTFLYGSASQASWDVVERFVLGDRLFFLVYAMLASALLAALTWDALVPDRHEQDIVGVLPVRPRTVAAARVASAATIASAFAAAISVPSGVFFAISATAHPALGFVPVVFIAHVAAMILGSLFVFLALLAVRGLLAMSPAGGHGIATLLQIMTIVGLVEVFLFLPGVLPALSRRMLAGDQAVALLPPVWFASLYSWLVGTSNAALVGSAQTAVLALVGAMALVAGVYLVPAAVLGRRTLEVMPRRQAALLTRLLGGGLLHFTIASLLRSRRHLLVLASYLGVAIAAGGVSLIVAGYRGALSLAEPIPSLLAMPLVLIFFLALGLRSAFSIPAELDANWPFRLAEPRLDAAVDAARGAMMLVAVIPIGLLATALGLGLGWTVATAARIAVFDVVSGLLLVELVLFRWRKAPFTCAHMPTADTFKSRWAFGLVALNLFAYRLGDAQFAALASVRLTLLYLAAICIAAVLVRSLRAALYRNARVQFDLPVDGLQTLGLSGALQ